MAECHFAKSCPFFQGGASQPSKTVSAWFRYQYCQGNFVMCARYTIQEALGQNDVPADMLPNEMISAQQILSRTNLRRGFVRKAA